MRVLAISKVLESYNQKSGIYFFCKRRLNIQIKIIVIENGFLEIGFIKFSYMYLHTAGFLKSVYTLLMNTIHLSYSTQVVEGTRKQTVYA